MSVSFPVSPDYSCTLSTRAMDVVSTLLQRFLRRFLFRLFPLRLSPARHFELFPLP